MSRAIEALLEEEDDIRMEGRVMRVRLRAGEPDPPFSMRPRV